MNTITKLAVDARIRDLQNEARQLRLADAAKADRTNRQGGITSIVASLRTIIATADFGAVLPRLSGYPYR